MDNLIYKLNDAIKKNEGVALLTITQNTGSSPHIVGTQMLVSNQGVILEGSIGGGEMDIHACKVAKESITKGLSRILVFDLSTQSNLSKICAGEIHIFIKIYPPRNHLILIGWGNIGKHILHFSEPFHFRISVIDHRDLEIPGVQFLTGPIMENLDQIQLDENTFVVIMTPGHKFDIEVLEYVVSKPSKYIGMIGSKKKVKVCFDTLIERGVSKDLLEKVYAPIGLNIGGKTPASIALSIFTQIHSIIHSSNAIHYKNI